METKINIVYLSTHTKNVRKVIKDHLELANEFSKIINGKKVYPIEIFGNIVMNHVGCNGPIGCSQRTIDMLCKLYKNSSNFKYICFEN